MLQVFTGGSARFFPVVVALLLVGVADPAIGQEPVEVTPSEIVEVTLYSSQARVTRAVDLAAAEGVQEVVIGPLPTSVIEDSLQTAGDAHLRVFGVRVERRSGEDRASDEYLALEREKQDLWKQRQAVGRRKEAAEERFARFMRLQIGALPRGGDDSPRVEIHPDSWSSVLDLVRKGLEEALKEKVAVRDEIAQIDRKVAAIDGRMNEIHVPGRDVRVLAIVQVQNRTGEPGRLEFSYRLPEALWHPSYAFRIDPDSGRLELSLYGVAHQRTGEDWPAVPIEFSTSFPENGADIPELMAQHIARARYAPEPVRREAARSSLPEPTFSARPDPEESQEFVSEDYVVNEVRARKEALRARGKKRAKDKMARRLQSSHDDVAAASNYADARELKKLEQHQRQAGEPRFKNLSPHRISPARAARGFIATYPSLRPEAVPSDGAPHRLLIRRIVLPYTENRVVVPELSRNVYRSLVATLTGNDPMLAGPAAIFHGDAYLGLTVLKTTAPSEELTVHLGVDDRIRVRRNARDREEEYGVFSKGTRYFTEVELSFENYHDRAVTVDVSERVPFTEHEDIAIVLDRARTDPPPTDWQEHSGIVRWQLNVKPGTDTTVELAYTIEAPKEFQLTRRPAPERLEGGE